MSRYFKELASRFDSGFDQTETAPVSPDKLTPPHGYVLVARIQDITVGCGSLRCFPAYAEIKRMWVDRAVRGTGVGSQLLVALETLARKSGAKVIRLDTNKALREAQRLYCRNGYSEVERFNDEPYADLWFEKTL